MIPSDEKVRAMVKRALKSLEGDPAITTYATLGEICDTLRGVYGEYSDAG